MVKVSKVWQHASLNMFENGVTTPDDILRRNYL